MHRPRPLCPTTRRLVKHKVSKVHVHRPVEGIAMHTRVKHIVVKIIHSLTEQWKQREMKIASSERV